MILKSRELDKDPNGSGKGFLNHQVLLSADLGNLSICLESDRSIVEPYIRLRANPEDLFVPFPESDEYQYLDVEPCRYTGQ